MREIVRRQTVGRGRGIGALLGWAWSWFLHETFPFRWEGSVGARVGSGP